MSLADQIFVNMCKDILENGEEPVCPKCGKAFDFMEIVQFRNKKYLAYLESEEE